MVASGKTVWIKWVSKCRSKVYTLQQDLMSDGSELQVNEAQTENVLPCTFKALQSIDY